MPKRKKSVAIESSPFLLMSEQIVALYKRMSDDERATLAAWEAENVGKNDGRQLGSGDWPGWIEIAKRILTALLRPYSYLRERSAKIADMQMNPMDFWKNFRLGEELSVSGAFIYNGLRRFYELRKLDNADEIFEVFYYLSIGLERLMKIAIVLLEHEDRVDQAAFEKSLITHSHQQLAGRIKKHVALNLAAIHNDFLSLLTSFYKTLRYDRFSLQSSTTLGKEKDALFDFLEKHLQVEFKNRNSAFGHENSARYKKFLRQVVVKISSAHYKIVMERARELNLYTYELRSGSKAESVFLGEADIHGEDTLWKELLIFFMNTEETSGYLKFLRGIEPLNFDPGLVDDYLDCFQSDSAKSQVMDELESLYEDLPNKKERIQMIAVIGAANVFFDDAADEEDDFTDESDR